MVPLSLLEVKQVVAGAHVLQLGCQWWDFGWDFARN
jgi:hypothetical protein